MSVDADAIEHFRLGREALVRKRREIDEAIRGVDRILADILESGQVQLPGLTANPAEKPPSIRQGTLRLLSDGESWPVARIMSGLQELGIQTRDNSVRSILNKLVHSGTLENPSRGHYQLPRPRSDEEGDET